MIFMLWILTEIFERKTKHIAQRELESDNINIIK